MAKKRAIYLFLSTTIVFVYLIMYSLLYQPSNADAQATVCFQITLENCVGNGCTPACPGTPTAAVRTGYTPGIYGIEIRGLFCKEG